MPGMKLRIAESWRCVSRRMPPGTRLGDVCLFHPLGTESEYLGDGAEFDSNFDNCLPVEETDYRKSTGSRVFILENPGRTLYTGETYQLQVDFPEHYPMEAPQRWDQYARLLSSLPLPSFSSLSAPTASVKASGGSTRFGRGFTLWRHNAAYELDWGWHTASGNGATALPRG
nr:unnamed protein product [Digitaria exilis]